MGISSVGFCKLDDENLSQEVFLKKMEESFSKIEGVSAFRVVPFISSSDNYCVHFSYQGCENLLGVFFNTTDTKAEQILPGKRVLFSMERLAYVDFLMQHACAFAANFGEVYWDKNDCDDIPYEKLQYVTFDLKGKKLVI